MERTKQLRSRTLNFLMFQTVYYASFNISPIADKPFIFIIVSCICAVHYFSTNIKTPRRINNTVISSTEITDLKRLEFR